LRAFPPIFLIYLFGRFFSLGGASFRRRRATRPARADRRESRLFNAARFERPRPKTPNEIKRQLFLGKLQ
jgi:hypothetical protein